MNQLSQEMKSCVGECLRCYQVCLGTAMTHCLETGGKHTEPRHFRLMMACAEICRTAAHFMRINLTHHKHVCGECAEICQECARDCEQIGEMQGLLMPVGRCAERCQKMAA